MTVKTFKVWSAQRLRPQLRAASAKTFQVTRLPEEGRRRPAATSETLTRGEAPPDRLTGAMPLFGSPLARVHNRVTVSYMKSSTLTIRLDDQLERELDRACARTGRTRSDLARDALRRQLALLRFERLRKRVLPLAESQGYLTDEDIFRDVS